MRDLGLENFWTVALFSTSLNLVGTISYAVGLILGIGKVSKEYNARVKDEIAKEECKHIIDARCRKMSIENKNYKDVKGVYKQYKDSLIEHQTLRKMCTLNLNNASEADILEAYQHTRAKVTQEMKFDLLPAEVSFVANLRNALNPLKPARVQLFANGQDSTFDGGPKFEEMVAKKSGHEKLGKIVPDSISAGPDKSQRIIR